MAKSIKDMAGGNALLLALMNILIGLVMLVMGNGSINWIFWISGIIMIIIGLIQIITKSADLKGGLITIIIGIIVIVLSWTPFPEILVGLILILCALPVLGASMGGLADKLGMAPMDAGNEKVNKILALILLILGVCLIVGLAIPDLAGVADILIRVGGAVLLIIGLVGLLKALK